jgi:predicted transcriptional regulator
MPEPNEKLDLETRRRKAADMYLQGWSQEAIAQVLDVAQSSVSRYLDDARAEAREAAAVDFDELRSRELQKVALVEREAWSAWERSQTPVASAVLTDGGKGTTSRRGLKHQHGDPRFLDLVNKCIAQRCLLLGLQPAPAASGGQADGLIPYELRRERFITAVAQLRHLDRLGDAGSRPDGPEPGGVCDGGQRGELADCAAPGAPRQGAVERD